MSGNLIDNKVKLYQQNVGVLSNNQQNVGSHIYSTTQQAPDSFESSETKKKEPNLFACILGSWFGINWISDAFNKSCSNSDYNKTIVGRLGNLGDKISNTMSNNSLVQKVGNGLSSMKSSVNGFINKSPLLSGIFNTPTLPENSNVLSFMETQYDADLKEAASIMEQYIKDTPKSFKEVNATKAEIQALKSKYGTGLFGGIKNKEKALLELQFNRLGAPAGYIDTLAPNAVLDTLQDMKIKSLGFADKASFEVVKSHPEKFGTEILEACKKGGANVKAMFNRTPLLTRSGNLAASTNKLLAETKHTTKLGKFLAKMPKILNRGLTFCGGRINTLLVAFGLGMAVKNTILAPKKQKVATAVSGGFDAVSWIVSMPLAIKAMFGINGMKYAGMGATVAEQKANVQKYRDALKAFNADQKAGLLNNKFTYTRRLVELNKLKESKVPLNKFQSFMKKFSDKFLSVGLEVPRPYQAATAGLKGSVATAAKMGNLKRMAGFLSKHAVAYPLRFAGYMLLFQPLVDKALTACTNAIFGKPYEAPEEKPKEEADNVDSVSSESEIENTANYQNNKSNKVEDSKPVNVNSLPNDNLIKRKTSGENFIKTSRYIPSETCGIPEAFRVEENPERTYIPSDECKVVSNYESDRETVRKALEKSRPVADHAIRFLNGEI